MVSPVGPSGAATTPHHDYVYRASLVSCHDADTQTYVLDLGFNVRIRVTIRVLGINAPELATPEGQVAQQAALAWLAAAGASDWPLIIASQQGRPVTPDKFGGRWDALIWRVSDGTELGAAMVAAGQAAPWSGQGVKPVPLGGQG